MKIESLENVTNELIKNLKDKGFKNVKKPKGKSLTAKNNIDGCEFRYEVICYGDQPIDEEDFVIPDHINIIVSYAQIKNFKEPETILPSNDALSPLIQSQGIHISNYRQTPGSDPTKVKFELSFRDYENKSQLSDQFIAYTKIINVIDYLVRHSRLQLETLFQNR